MPASKPEARKGVSRPLIWKIRTARKPRPSARQQIRNISAGKSRAETEYSAVAKALTNTKGRVRLMTTFFSASTPSRLKKFRLRHSMPKASVRNTGKAVSSTEINIPIQLT